MADQPPKPKRQKPADGVLGSLPATRPSRMSRRARTDGDGPSVEATRAAGTRAKATRAASKPRKKKPVATKAAEPAKPGAAKLAPAAGAAPAKPARPRATRPASPALKAPAEKAEAQREDSVSRPAPSGTELVTTVVQAAGELASIGVTIGGQILKRAAGKLPRP